MQYREGQTATNPKTGQRVVFRGGQWVSAGAVPAKPSAAQEKQSIANRQTLADLTAVEKQYLRTKNLYEQDFKGVGPGSLLEYLPTPSRKRFDASSAMLSTLMKPLIRGPGEGIWTDADQERLDSLVPSGGRMDSDNEERMKAIELLIRERRAKHGGAAQSGWKVTKVK